MSNWAQWTTVGGTQTGGTISAYTLSLSSPLGRSPASYPGPAQGEGRGTNTRRHRPAAPACAEVEGRQGSGGQVVGREAGHAELGAALAQDGQLGAPIHSTAGQGWVPVLEVHSEVTVHLPAPPFPLNLCLDLQRATCMWLPSVFYDLAWRFTSCHHDCPPTSHSPAVSRSFDPVCLGKVPADWASRRPVV